MRVKSIVIILEPTPVDPMHPGTEMLHEREKAHATELTYEEGMWTSNGPLFPRFGSALYEIIKLLKGGRG